MLVACMKGGAEPGQTRDSDGVMSSLHQFPPPPPDSGDLHTNGESGEPGSGIVSRGVLTSFFL